MMKHHSIIDLHAHPSLKLYYFPYLFKSFKVKTFSGPIFNPLGMRTRYSNINKSSVKVIINAHYVIEKNFLKEGFKKPVLGLLWGLAPSIIHKIMSEDPYESLLKQFDLLEEAVGQASGAQGQGKLRNLLGKALEAQGQAQRPARTLKMLFSFGDIEKLGENEVGVVHAIEGAHSLGEPRLHESNEQFFEVVKNRLFYLKSRGLAVIGISHFWDNMFLPQTDGTEIILKKKISPPLRGWDAQKDNKLFHMKRADWKWGDNSKLSKEFIEFLLGNNILIDVVHTQEHARNEIYKLCKKHNKPLIVSHVGLQHFFDHEYNLSDEELLKIHALKGIVGLILSKRWLTAPKNRNKQKGGIEDLIENIKYIKKLTGDISIVGIGTDFDGFTTPFKDCYTYAQMDNITKRLKEEFSKEEVEAILNKNALRVLKLAWK